MSNIKKDLGFESPEKEDLKSYNASLAQRKSLVESNRSILDSDTYAEMLAKIDNAEKNKGPEALRAAEGIDAIIPQVKEGMGIFGVRRMNEEFAKLIKDRPGVARQTVLTSGQNTTGVGSLGLFKQGPK